MEHIFEMTVITGMCNKTFKMTDGQFAIEIIDSTTSFLKQLSRGQLKEICKL